MCICVVNVVAFFLKDNLFFSPLFTIFLIDNIDDNNDSLLIFGFLVRRK